MSKTIKVLFLGDIVGRPGRETVEKFLFGLNVGNLSNDFSCPKISNASQCFIPKGPLDTYDLVIANVENASHGFGLTKKNHDELISYGITCMTSGNHVWDKKDIYTYIDESNVLIRPLNYHKTARGVGYRIFNDKIIVINLLGKTFMQPVICPFQALYDTLLYINNQYGTLKNKIIIVDFHSEATAEKICFAHFAKSMGVSAVLGTHTHVQTADEKIIDFDFEFKEDFEIFPEIKTSNENSDGIFNKNVNMAYISDVGFSGSYKSVIGMEYESSLRRLVSSIPERFDVADSDIRQINAAEIEFDPESSSALDIKRINLIYNKNEDKVS